MKAFDGCEFAVNPTSPSSLMDFEPWQLIELIDHLSLVSVQPKDESTGRRRKETAETLHENLDPADEAGLPLLPPSPAKRTQSPAKMKRTLPGKMGKSTSFLVPVGVETWRFGRPTRRLTRLSPVCSRMRTTCIALSTL